MNLKTKLLPTHSRYLDTHRAKMIQRHEPEPYEDLWGPTVLSLMLIMVILANFLLKIYSTDELKWYKSGKMSWVLIFVHEPFSYTL